MEWKITPVMREIGIDETFFEDLQKKLNMSSAFPIEVMIAVLKHGEISIAIKANPTGSVELQVKTAKGAADNPTITCANMEVAVKTMAEVLNFLDTFACTYRETCTPSGVDSVIIYTINSF